jgi:hypothetical protein
MLPVSFSKHVLVSLGYIVPTHNRKSLSVGVDWGFVRFSLPDPVGPDGAVGPDGDVDDDPFELSSDGIVKHLSKSNCSVSNVPPVHVQNPLVIIIDTQQDMSIIIIINAELPAMIYNKIIFFLL